jgi:hypothetical protein
MKMPNETKPYHTLPFAVSRQLVADAGRLARRRSLIHGLVEFDVTHPRALIHQHKAKTGETLSFTGFLVSCLAKAIEAHPMTHAHLSWRNQLVVYDDVDVVTLIEPEAGAQAFPHIIRAANRKTFRQIHDEIRAIQTRPAKSDQQSGRLARWGPYVPTFIRMLFYRVLMMNPHWLKKYAGTVIVTAVGMFAHGTGWGLGYAPFHTLSITVGSIAERPVLAQDQIGLHEYLCLTITFDHLVVDGAPAARFAEAFKKLVESGYGLDSETIPVPPQPLTTAWP